MFMCHKLFEVCCTWLNDGSFQVNDTNVVCNTPIFNISLLELLLDDINFNIINSIDLFDIINLIIRIYWKNK